MASDPSRLFTTLLNTGLQVKDNPLYQVIHDLIGAVVKVNNDINGTSGGGGGSSVVTIVNQTIQQLNLDGGSGGDGGSSDTIPGPPGADGANGMVPYFIALGDTFKIPLYKQALFSMNIDNQGILDIEGFLIEVD